MQAPLVINDFLRRARELYGGVEGVVCGDVRLTYGQFGRRVDAFAAGLARRGVGRGDVVAFVTFNCHRLLEAYYAVPQMGAILLPINIRLTADDIEYILDHSKAKVVVVDRALQSLLKSPQAAVLTDADYEELIAEAVVGPESSRPYPSDLPEDEVAELFYTSGTTARPKGVMLTHRNLVAHAYSVMAMHEHGDHDVQLHSIPLFHVNGWGTPHTLTCVGGRHVVLPKFDPALALETIERERVTKVFMVPTMALALANHPDAKKRDVSSLRRIMIGGAAMAPALLRQLDEWLPECEVTAGYGLSETTPVVTIAVVKRGMSKDRETSRAYRVRAGLPCPGVRLEIFDDDMRALPHDGVAAGEVCVRSNVVMKGYLHDDEATAQAFRGGWFHTGDVGAIDAEGYLSIVDRSKDIIISGGENISSLDVEKAVLEHPSVLECAVIALPDDQWGEVPAAVVVLRPGQTADEAAILTHCRQHLAGFKTPKKVFFLDELPKGGTGKILKRELRLRYALSGRPQ